MKTLARRNLFKLLIMSLLLATFTNQLQAQTDGSAELPRATVDTQMPSVTGRTITVNAGDSLQAALNAAQPGDQIVLQAGATFIGNFVLPAKPGMGSNQWIIVRTNGQLPAPSTRVNPSNANQMPKILTPNAARAIETAPGAQGWRLVGLEIATTDNLDMTYSILAFGTAGSEQTTLSQVPSRMIVDRSYVHGTPTLNVRRCIALNSASSAVIDSYISECHSRDGDSQAILGYNGPGPFKILNNYLEAGHEVIAFGGADPSIPNLVPSDIEIRGNYVTRPLSWKGVWLIKNLVEFNTSKVIKYIVQSFFILEIVHGIYKRVSNENKRPGT
jgi:hypothetical protein